MEIKIKYQRRNAKKPCFGLTKLIDSSDSELDECDNFVNKGSKSIKRNLDAPFFVDDNHGAQVSSISEDVLELDNLSSKSSIFTICPRKVLDFY